MLHSTAAFAASTFPWLISPVKEADSIGGPQTVTILGRHSLFRASLNIFSWLTEMELNTCVNVLNGEEWHPIWEVFKQRL